MSAERMPLFLTGWRYVSTAEEAAALPPSSVAIVDDAFLWDADCSESPIVPELRLSHWDGVVDVQQSDYLHNCDPGSCSESGCGVAWFETDNQNSGPLPELPFFAWHPTFCTVGGTAPTEENP